MNSNNATRCAAFRAQSHNSFRYIIFEMSKTLHEKISCWVIRPWQANQLVSAEKSPRNRAEAAKKWGVHVVRAAKNFATTRRAYQKRKFLATEHHEIISIQIWSYDESSKIFQLRRCRCPHECIRKLFICTTAFKCALFMNLRNSSICK